MKQVFDLLYCKHRNIILYSVFVLYLLSGMVRNSTFIFIDLWDIVSRVIQIFCGFVLVIYLLLDLIKGKFKVTLFLIIGMICALGALVFAHTISPCYLIAFIYVFKDCKFEQIARIFAITTIVGLLMIYSFALMGYIDNLVQSRGDISRVCLGFLWSVPPMAYFFFACLAYNYVLGKKISHLQLALELLVSLLLYNLTNTRTGFALMFLLVLASCLFKVLNTKKIENYLSNDKPNKVFSVIFAILPILSVLAFGGLVLLYGLDVSFTLKINELLSGRLALTWNAFCEHSITLFGDTYNWTINGNYTGVDSAFYHYLFNCGILPTLFILFVTVCLYYQAFRQRKYWLCFILLLILCESVIDVFYWDIRYNVFLLILIESNFYGRMIFGKKSAPQVDKNDTVKPQNENLKNSEGVAN